MGKRKAFKLCKACGFPTHRSVLSHRGLCSNCSFSRVREANLQMQRKEGSIYLRWKRATEAAQHQRVNAAQDVEAD